MKRGIILINAYTKSEHELNQPLRLREELAALGVNAEIVRNRFPAFLNGEGEVSLSDPPDFCVYLDKDKYTGEMLEKRGVRLFNPIGAIADCDDKMRTYLALGGFGIPMPKTFAAPLCYYPDEPYGGLELVERELGYPIVVKECYGSLGKGVSLARDRAELSSLAERLKCRPHLFQEFIEESRGRDVRVIVVGGKAIGSMLRISDCDFRSNAELGGKGVPYGLSEEGRLLCEKIARILRLDYCGIDLLFGKEGFLLCEVNSNAFFGTFERVTGVNAARAYAEHIFKIIYGEKK